MKIDGYEITSELYSSRSGLKVYEAIDGKGTFVQIRVAGCTYNTTGLMIDNWYGLYGEYESSIINFKYLPRVLTISRSDSGPYTVLECEEGKLLKEVGSINVKQISELMEAVGHLHRKKFIHGSIVAENIWITNEGRIVLFGAGETRAWNKADHNDEKSDISQIVKMIAEYALLKEEFINSLINKHPISIEQLEDALLKAEQYVVEKIERKKGGLVEKEEQKKVAPLHQDEKQKQEEQILEPPHTRQTKRRKFRFKKVIISLVNMLVILLIVGFFIDKEFLENVKGNGFNSGTYQELEQDEALFKESDVPFVSKEEISAFLTLYKDSYLASLNSADFSYIEPYLAPDQMIYEELNDYIASLSGKDVSFEDEQFEIVAINQVREREYAARINEKFIFTDSYGAKTRYTKEKIYRLHIVGENDIEIVSIGKISDMETPITKGDNSKK